ncbi:MAG: family 10 glycosylhydrolase, partial [Chloroflexota bacterium]
AGFKSPPEVDQLVRDMQTAHANVVFAQVRKRGDAYFNQTIEPRADDLRALPDFDPLAYLIARAHAANPPIEVHAWLNALSIANANELPTDPSHIFAQHGPDASGDALWLASNANGRFIADNLYFLDPGHPAAAQHIVNVYLNLVRNYDVDGIHLDFIRYAGNQWGYNLVSLARFNARIGATGTPAAKDARWSQWRRDQVTALVRQIYLQSIAVKPNLKVSAALIAWGNGPQHDDDWQRTSAYSDVLQDWQAWLQEGILDLAVPMNYDNERNAQQAQWFDQWIEWEKNHTADRQLVVGLGAFLNDFDGTLAQLQRARTPSATNQRAHGVALYSYASSDPRGLAVGKFFRALTQPDDATGAPPPFASIVRAPTMAWKTNPTTGHLMGVARLADGRFADGLTVMVSGATTRTLLTSGTGFFGATALPPGAYTVTIARGAQTLATAQTTVSAGQVATVDFERVAGE